ncbi:MAG: efflux RND transporter periplasmic adaptor subunit [Gammaproteobacteria bacterium]|nr:efflux RND transporter periplasmic adaptor subunit [Gammaproteobacteria bacterium]
MFRIILFCSLMVSGSLLAKDLPAVLDWQQRVGLGTLVDGVVNKVNVSPGDRVTRGSLLVELDQRELQSRLAWAEARAAASKLEQDEARRELDRSLDLYDRTLISDHERKQAEVDAAKADAQARLAEAELTHIRLHREYSRIKAPFDGLVIEVLVHPGQALVNHLQSQSALTLADMRRMKARARVSLEAATELQLGQPVKVGVRGVWVEGQVSFIGLEPIAGGQSTEYRIEVLFTPPEQFQLRAGEPSMVRIDD